MANGDDFADYTYSEPADCAYNEAIQDAEGCPGEDAGLTVLNDGESELVILVTVGYQVPGTTTPTPAVLTLPAPGSTLTGSSATFKWSAGTGVTEFVLGIGTTGVGSYNIFNSGYTTNLEATVTNLPTNGGTLYVRLFSMINGAWQHNDYTYTAYSAGQPAVLTSPTPGSELTGSSATFKWSAGTDVTEYVLGVGTTGVGSYNLFNSGYTTALQASVTNLPTTGGTVYVRIFSKIAGVWQYEDYTYAADSTYAVLTSPAVGSLLPGSSVTFQWSAGTGATEYVLGLGTTGAGSYNLFNSGYTTARQATATNLPTNGETIYARIFSLVGGVWQHNDYTYTANTPLAVLTTPTPGSTLTGSSVTFEWTAGTGVTEYVLGVGTTGVGSYNLLNSGYTTALQATATDLPTTGGTVYARLFSLINGAWQHIDYTYTAK